jgi:hypothetical protein
VAEAFVPTTRYYQAIDALLCLVEDVSYRSQPINEFLEVLWHPQESYLVGIKLLHAKRLHRSMDMLPTDKPVSLLLYVCAAMIENDEIAIVEPGTTVALQAFIQQHRASTDITPLERKRLEFTLVKPRWRVSIRGGTGYTLVAAIDIEEAQMLGAAELNVPVSQVEADRT